MLKIFVKTDRQEKFLSDMVHTGIDFYSPEKHSDGVMLEISFFDMHRFKKISHDLSFSYIAQPKGIVSYLYKRKKRLGIIIGSIFGIFLFYLSTFFVWSVKIDGEGDVELREVIESLAREGLYEGVLKKRVDVNEVAQSFLADRSEFSFCSINISGVVAHVELKRRIPTRFSESKSDPYNLLSDSDGVVVKVEALNGNAEVKAGDTVYKGQLVVSGVVQNTTNDAYRLVRAEGRVWAKVKTTLSFSVPLQYVQKKYIGEDGFTAVRVLGHRIGYVRFPKTGNYDIVTNFETPNALGFELPFSFEKILYAFYVEKTVKLTENEALCKAHDLYRKRAVTEFDGAVILEETFSHRIEDEVLILEVVTESIRDICVREKIKTE